MVVDSLIRFAPLVLALPWALAALLEETKRIRAERPPVLIPLLVLVLPFYGLVFPGHRYQLLMQAAAVAAVIYYFNFMKRSAMRASMRRVRPILLPAAALVAVTALSYAVSTELTRSDVYTVFNLVAAVAYIVLAGIYCRSLPDFARLIRVLVLVAVLQLPVVIAQAAGVASALPGGFGALDPSAYGGALAGTVGMDSVVVRYPGSFGDYELLAEFCGLMFIVCMGMLVFGLSGRARWPVMMAAVVIVVTGWFTGTRAFVLVALGGLLVLGALALLQSGRRFSRLARLAAVLGMVGGAALLVIPDSLRRGFIERLGTTSFSGSNAFNRASLFEAWIDLAGRMPWSGYGPHMPDMLRVGYPAFRGIWPHSLYFTVLLTSGLLGLVALIWMLVTLLYLALSTALTRASVQYRHWAAVMAAAAIYWVANEAKIEMVRLVFYVDILFLLFGMVSSLHVLAVDDRRTSARKVEEAGVPDEFAPSGLTLPVR